MHCACTHHSSGRSSRSRSSSWHSAFGTPTAQRAPTGMPAASAVASAAASAAASVAAAWARAAVAAARGRAEAAAAVRTRHCNPNCRGRCRHTLPLCSTRDSCLHQGCGSSCMWHTQRGDTWDHAHARSRRKYFGFSIQLALTHFSFFLRSKAIVVVGPLPPTLIHTSVHFWQVRPSAVLAMVPS